MAKRAPNPRLLAPILAICVAGSTLTACGDAGALDGLPQGREGRVTAVLSGDAFVLDGKETVKLAGIEAPQADAPYALAARQALARLLTDRRVILFFSGKHADDAGRTVAQVEDADNRRWTEGAMLEAGAARVRTTSDDRMPAKAMLAREAMARRGERGLWTMPMYGVRLPDEVGRYEDGFILVEGRVRRVGQGRGSLYLDFSTDWWNTVAVSIPRDALRAMRTAGVDPFDLQGRLIRVRGPVFNRRLTVDHPEQIERLSD